MNEFKSKSAKTYEVKIYMAGPTDMARFLCQKYCTSVGLCVTVTETEYVYKYGSESGFVVGLINYPRFPQFPEKIEKDAYDLAMILANDLDQGSFTIVTPTETTFYSRRGDI